MSATPILDLEIDPPALRSSHVGTLGGMLVGVVIGVTLIGKVYIDPVWWLPILYLSIAVHELGHLAAAKLAGMDVGGIAVGGIVILKSGSRWICRFEWRRILSGGLAKPLAKNGTLSAKRYAWVVAGGPIATALLAGLAALALRQSPDPDSDWLPSLQWINLFLLFATMIPASGLNQSDIPRLLQILFRPAIFRAHMAAMQVQSEETIGVLPRDWNPEWFDAMMAPTGSAGSGAAGYRHMLAFYRKIDEGDDSAALTHLEAALAASGFGGRPIRHWVFLEAAASSALLRSNPEAARTWLDRARNVRRPDSTASIEAAIAQAEGRYQDAFDLWNQALAYIERRRVDSGLARFAKTKIAAYQMQCRQALASHA